MLPVKIPRTFTSLFPGITWRINDPGRTLYLTFDDGPTPEITDAVLEILDSYNARATFFCIGRNAERHPALYRKIIAKQHVTGNHTYSHLKGWYTNNAVYYNDIILASRFIDSGLFRPAYGLIKPSQVRYLKHHYRIVMWSVLSYDYDSSISPQRCLNNVIRHADNGSIVVFHDSVKASNNVLSVLPKVLDHFSNLGFIFKALSC